MHRPPSLGPEPGQRTGGLTIMLYTIVVILVIMWLLGMVTGTTMGGLVHLLLVVAVVVLVLNLLRGRAAV